MRINPRQIEAFRAVMIAGGVGAAADSLHVTQPAVSRLIRSLEANAGFPLFQRDGNRLVPRAEARALFREVDRLYAGLDHVARTIEDIRIGRGGVLRVGAVAALATCCMADLVAALSAAHEDVALTFDTENSGRIVELTALGHYDVGLIYGSAPLSGVRVAPLATAPAVCVLAPGHALAAQPGITPEMFVAARVILPGRQTPLRIRLDDVLARHRLRCARPIETSLHNCCRLVEQGVGIALVDPLTAGEFSGRLVIRPFLPEIAVEYGAIQPPQAPGGRLTDRFVAAVHDAVRRRLSAPMMA